MVRKLIPACLFIALFFTHNAFAQAPVISSFTPANGPVQGPASSTTLTINGSNFNGVANNNIVYFGAVVGTVTAASPTSLSVLVPPGALFQPFSVLNTANGLQGYSSVPFAVTFPSIDSLNSYDFDPRVDVATSGTSSNPNSVAIGDFDGDGLNDIVVTQSDETTLAVIRNSSTFGNIFSYSFNVVATLSTLVNNVMVKIADVDGDGKPDIITYAQVNGTTISVFRNTSTLGSISFATPATFVDNNGGNGQRGMAIADIDDDGKPDVIIGASQTYPNPFALHIFQNTSTPGNVSFSLTGPYPTAIANIIGIATGDLDGDGKQDVIVTDPINSNIGIMRNTSTGGTISFTNCATVTSATQVWEVLSGDFDGDGKQDIVGTGPYQNKASVYRNTTSGANITFATGVDFTTGGQFTDDVSVNDFDGDGKNDFIIPDANGHVVFVYRNTSTPGQINTSSFVKTATLSGATTWCIVSGDMDNDGKPDIVSCSDYDVVSVYRNDPMPIISPAHPSVCFHNNIDLSVTPEATYQWQVDTGTGFYNLSNIAPYNGVYTDTLHITDADTAMNGYIYRCMVMNSNITKYSKNDTLAVHPLPVPVITGTPPFYNTGSFASYQWLMNGNVINGATSQHYTATQSGTYSVLVTDVYGCSDTSATVTLVNAGLAGLNSNGIINIYPNPASEQLVVDAPIPVQASITDELGRQIIQVDNAHYLNIHQLQAGIYFIVVTDKDGSILKREKIVKE